MTAKEFYKKSFLYPVYAPFIALPFTLFAARAITNSILRFIGGVATYTLFTGIILAIPYLITYGILRYLMKDKNTCKIKKILNISPLLLLLVELITFIPILSDNLFSKNPYINIAYITFITLGIGYLWIGIVFYIGNKLEKKEQNFDFIKPEEINHLSHKAPSSSL